MIAKLKTDRAEGREFGTCFKMRLAGGIVTLLIGSGIPAAAAPAAAAVFESFAPSVKLRWDQKFLYIESNGLPAHGMMVGISNWQQQVPLPQAYTGQNAWQLPLVPVPAKQMQTVKDHFLRGAIGIAANGIPIFNPQNNRGEIAQEIGELDQWGGHCGKADDYHYHAAPLHLQATVGEGKPIAYALDGYPIYGLTEPGGETPVALDECHGHTTAALGYHYHASETYPYVIGGFHGVVTERGNQVDPQPRAEPLRQALPPLAGAVITDYRAIAGDNSFALEYQIQGKTGSVKYSTASEGCWLFQYLTPNGTQSQETYTAGDKPDGPPPLDGPPPDGPPPGPRRRPPPPPND